jgi:hypothetical protein
MPTKEVQPRHVWWVRVGDKRRPCVVLRVESDCAQVIYGQGLSGGVNAVEVKLGSPDGRRMGIQKDTYFRETNVLFVPLADCATWCGFCPPRIFSKIQVLVYNAPTISDAQSEAERARTK